MNEIQHILSTTDDAKSMSEIIAASWKHGYKDLIEASYLDSIIPNHWENFLKAGLSDFLYGIIQRVDGRPSAAAVMRASGMEAFADDGEILCFYMVPEYMRKGYGGALLAASEARLIDLGFDFCILSVLESNVAAKSFYFKHGFTETDLRVPAELGGRQIVCDILRKRLK